MRVAVWFVALWLTTTTISAASRVALPSLTAQDDDGRIALPIHALQVDVLIRGHLARTTYEVTFRNDLDRDLDGQFSFPLPPDAEVSDLGLYFNGRLRRAVAVERVQARTAYEETVQRRVDPALAEWSASTRAFRFRVYPIPANGTKVVHIAYDQDLTSTLYEVDLRYGLSLASFELKIDSDGDVESDGLPLRRSGNEWRTQQRNAPLQGVVHATRDASEYALAAWSSSDKSWCHSAPTRIRSTAQALAPATAVTLLYDVSSSAVQRDDAALQTFLRTFLGMQRDRARVTVLPFHVRVEPAFETDAVALEQRLAELPRAGATNLVTLLEQLPEIVRATGADSRIVIVTDGIHTIGDSARLARAIAAAARVGREIAVINTSPSADDTTLARIAAATGGWHIDLTRMSVSEAANALMRLPMRIAVRPAAPGIRDILPASLTISADTTTTIQARSAQRLLRLPLAIGNGRRELVVRELYTDEERDLVRKSWARASLRMLLERGAPAEEVLAHGLRFQQLTPQTSLLVLDTWQDYDAYGIPLPAELREQRAKELEELEAEQRRNQKQSSVVLHGVAADAASHRAAWFIKGVVTHEQAAIPGVTVSMLVDGAPEVGTFTDGEGRFWITAPRAPARFTLRAHLEGFDPVTHAYPHGTPKGAVIEIVLHMASVAEAITVTAEAPMGGAEGAQMTSARTGSLVRPTPEALADTLLAQLVGGSAPITDEDVESAPFEERVKRITAVVARLRSLQSPEERFRYYVAARSAIGGDKYFQAEAALAMHADAPELAVRALTDLAESYPDDAPTLRLLGRILDGWGFGDLARLLFERALELSPRETQTWRELLLLTAKEDRPSELAELQRRFSEAKRDERMMQTETAIGAELQRSGHDRRIDEASELQVEVMWDSNYTDIDLQVLEPSGEQVSYQHLKSQRGGLLHDDVTSGFGPETYTLPRMETGTYEIALDYYAGDDTRLGLQALAHVIVYVRGERRDYVVPLTGEEDRIVVARVSR